MSIFVLKNIKKSFIVNKTENVVLDSINISFPDFGLVSILGKSGSGKSTLLNILMGIEKPTEGKVLFKGKNIAKFSDKKYSKFHLSGVSTIFQHYNLFEDLTAFQNVALPLKMKSFSNRKIRKIVKAEFEKLGLTDLMHKKVRKLSGGEKQRVAILRAIVTSPSAILCDEPTGALDFKNSREIMGILKKLSSEKLVVMVSHNKELVNEFSDYVITLKDGKIVNNSIPSDKENKVKYSSRRQKYDSSWISIFLKTNFKKNIFKNMFSILACSIGFASVFLCVGFLVGSEKSHDEALRKNLSIGNATVSKVEYVEITGSPLTYQKTVRPELADVDEEFKEFSTVRIEENLSYFVSSCATCVFNGSSFSSFQMVPLYDLSLNSYGSDLLIEGRGGEDNFDEIVINQEFESMVGESLLNKEIILRNNASTNYKTYDEETPFINDELIIEKPLKVVGIVKEFPFLNSPKIYYSYIGAKNHLKGELMENLSYYMERPYSFYDYLVDCDADDAASSYSSNIFLINLDESEQFFEKIKSIDSNRIEVTSSVVDIKDTYVTFIDSFSKTLLVFSIIAFVGINFILGMISLSSFLQNRKNAAVMTCLGSRNSSIYKLHLYENYIIIALSFWISLFLANIIQKYLNPYISNKFSLSNLITIPFDSFLGISYGLIILLAATVVITSTLFTMVPMVFYRHGYITEELRDE